MYFGNYKKKGCLALQGILILMETSRNLKVDFRGTVMLGVASDSLM